jgi:cytosine/adenosine deaminase-related metal-dependent hydrolase
MGHPVAFRVSDAGCRACLGLDITSSQGNDCVAQMRLMLQVQRAFENKGRFPMEIKRKTAEALRMGTLGGAEAMRLENITGSIMPGKQADLVMFRCDAINTTPCVNPVGEVVFHTSSQNIDTVIINGRIVKRDGKLVGIDWPMLREELRKRCERIVIQGNKVDLESQIVKWKPLFEGQRASGKVKL